MAKIQIQPDCGNAPRKLFLRDFNIALANGEFDFIQEIIPEQIDWELVGQKQITGKEYFLKTIKAHKLWKVKELIVDAIITHGYDASVSGQVITSDKSKYRFCDIYRFKSAGGTTIKKITTFLIKL